MTSPPIELSGVFAGRYALEAEIGRGGSSIVYRAHDTASGGTVAIKLLREELVASIAATRFLREVRLLAALAHPGIIPVIDSGEIDGRLFVALPYLRHGTLRALLTHQKQLPIPDAVSIGRTLCAALQFAHEQGIVHRDVKPENILFAEDGPCLADFGIARAIERSMDETLTTTGVALGTPAYMSPEQAAGEHGLDARTDVYSLGCVLYEMISGMQAFAGPNRQSVISQRLVHGPRPLRVYRPAVPAALEAVVEKALMALPADRFQSAAELGAALASVPDAPTMPEDLGSGRSSPDMGAYASILLRRRIRRGLVGGGVVGALMVAGWYIASLARTGPLDANKVVVFPLVERGEVRPGNAIGDEVALLIGSAFEHTEPLKWIDGWTWLDSTQRENPSRVSPRQARRIARNRGAKFYLEGSVLARRDSVTVVTRLFDVAGDTVFAQNTATAATLRESAPVVGVRAVIPLLPRLVDPSRTVDLRPILDRRPAAIASFLQGEREYRQSRFVEALAQYRRAVEADSSLALGAIKGAQAASWVDLTSEGHALIAVALAHKALLPPRFAQFANGLEAWFRGSADSAAAGFRRALTVDSTWAEAWTALGEVYFHLFPEAQALDSLAEAAFERARRDDREFAPPVFHLAELALRAGEIGRARELLAEFRRFRPDSNWVTQLELTVDCARGAGSDSRWLERARRASTAAVKAGKSLALIARHYDCAERAFRAALINDSLSLRGRWMATFGLHNTLVARGRVADAERLLDSMVASGLTQARALYVLDAVAGVGMVARAQQVMQSIAGPYKEMTGYRLWYHTVWQAHRGQADSLAEIHAALRTIFHRTGTPDDRFFSDVVSAHLALARRDTTDAIRLLRSIRVDGAPGEVTWGLWYPMATERLALARALLSRGRYAEAISAANAFDHPQAMVNLIFLPASLTVRVMAAEGLHDEALAKRFRDRLSALGRFDLARSLP